MSWRVAKSLDVLLAELNAAAPNRSKASDGSIGDAAHASRSSDHNPWITYGGQGIVRARDFTHDPAGGLDCQRLSDHLVGCFRDGHLATASGAYIIWRRRILSRDRLEEGWRTYTGSNPHDHHLHLSVATSASGFDSTRPWGWGKEADMPLNADDLTRIAAAFEKALEPVVKGQQAILEQSRNQSAMIRRLGKAAGVDVDKPKSAK